MSTCSFVIFIPNYFETSLKASFLMPAKKNLPVTYSEQGKQKILQWIKKKRFINSSFFCFPCSIIFIFTFKWPGPKSSLIKSKVLILSRCLVAIFEFSGSRVMLTIFIMNYFSRPKLKKIEVNYDPFWLVLD